MLSDEIRRYMLDSLASGHSPTIREVMEKFSCSRRTAQYVRAALLKSGAIPAGIIRKGGRPLKQRPSVRLPNSESPTDLPANSASTDEQAASAMVQRVLSGESVPLTTEQQRALLSELILHSPNHAIKVAAQNSLTKLDAQTGGGVSYSPGVPLTVEQRVKRLSLLMQACGFQVVKLSLKTAFPRAATLPDLIEENDVR